MTTRPRWWLRVRGTPDVAGCLEVSKTLQAYLDGEIDDLSARRIRRHLEICRRCGLEAETYTEIKQAIARRGGTVPGDAVERLRDFGERVAGGELPGQGGA